ncbi:MAG: hypothetical protein US43_C0021G0007 [Candidatus Levybacteria bacterium GW2011_GWA1_37_16]|nr:MAG: hypothetical protein US43_C0021G0007 [Candidatus Levybacteria bacterium GW2011_GWA1_37_16]KKQ41607.1 MAG: hypothetical protein US59_C0026G0004 [Candidatus Levybacteria bacterium GW2011_GWB1_37_8]
MDSWLNAYLKTLTADGTSEIIESKKAVRLTNYPGFTFSVRSLGIGKSYVLQKNAESNYAVIITQSVSDPQNVGYLKDVDQILSILEILK